MIYISKFQIIQSSITLITNDVHMNDFTKSMLVNICYIHRSHEL
jgi:hypothetical protein